MAASSSDWDDAVAYWSEVGELGMEAALRGAGCSEQSIVEILSEVKSNRDIFELVKLNNLTHPESARAVVLATIGRDISLTKTDFSSADVRAMTLNAAAALCVNLCSNTNITELILSNMNVFGTVKGCGLLAHALATNSSLRDLYLGKVDMGSAGVRCLLHGLKSNKTLEKLNLGGNPLLDEGISCVAKFLINNATIKYLYLHDTGMSLEGAKQISSVLASNITLRELVVGVEAIGREGMKILLQPLSPDVGQDGPNANSPQNTSLERLYLGYPNRACVESVTHMIKTNKSLRTLGLGRADTGKTCLAPFLPTDWTEAIIPALKANSTLTELYLLGCEGVIGDDVYECLLDLLQTSDTGLEDIRLGQTGLESRQEQINEQLRINKENRSRLRGQPQTFGRFVLCGYGFAAPAQQGTLKPNLDKVKSDFNAKEKGEFVDEQKGPVVDLARRADEFRRDVEKGGKYGYFVSSKCLLRLEESQRQSLMAILWEAGYSEVYRTTTTTLFARLKNDEENRTTPYGASSALKERPVSRRDMDDIGPSEGDDDLLGSAGRGVNRSRSCNVTDIFESDNPAGTSSIKSFEEEILPAGDPLETGTLSREDGLESQFCENVTTEMSEPTPTPSLERIEQKQQTSVPTMSTKPSTIAHAEQQAATLRSFKAALKSKSYPSFCVSRRWLSDLNDDEQKALSAILEAGYKKIYETGTDTWYERLGVRVQSPGDGEVGDDSSSSSKRSSLAGGDITKSGASKSGDSLAPGKGKRNVNDDDTSDTSGSPSRDTTENKRNEDFPCSPLRLKVACSSLARTPSILPSSSDEIIEQYGDEEFVTVPNLRRRGLYLISTSIDRRFSIPAIAFSDEGHAVMGTKSMNAKAISSLGCCVDHRNLKVRIKFSKISGEIKGIDPKEQQSNVFALSCLGTSVYSCTRKTEDEDDFEPVALHLDEVYHPHSQGRPVEKSRTSDVLVSLKLSSSHANNSSSASITLGLQADADKRLANDLETNVRRAHTLSFDDARSPVIFEGSIDEESHVKSFLEVQVRYKLEVCYVEPSISAGDNSLFCPCSPLITQPVDLNCCLTIRSENL